MKRARVLSGLDRIETVDDLLMGSRIGLMTNPTGVTHDLKNGIEKIAGRYELSALLACEHGVRGNAQAGAEVDSFVDDETGVRVYSTYGGNHRLTDEMLSAFDVFVFDIQDVGARFYTYLYSLAYAMEECAKAGKKVVVLDRLNPLSGSRCEGILLEEGLHTFVGDYGLPTRYGLTIGEFARYVKDYLKLKVDLTVVPLEGWQREMYLDDTDVPWVAPSPNCQALSTALCYIGTCIFEGTNVSEGRGTTTPFEVIGAPWLAHGELEKELNGLGLPGLRFRRCFFTPTFSKFQGETCKGLQIHVTDRDKANLPEAGLLLLDAIRRRHPDQFRFLGGADGALSTVDRLLGTSAYRLGQCNPEELFKMNQKAVADFQEKSRKYWLY